MKPLIIFGLGDIAQLAHFYFTTSQLNRVAETLHLCPPPLRGWEWHYLRRLCRLERKVLSGHAGPVKAIQYSPDGRLLATTSKDGTIRTWDVETGKPLRSWPSGSRFTHSVCFSGDGRLLITASQEEDVTVWDVANGKPLQRLPGAGSMVAASHEGRLVATVFRHEVVTVWNLAEQGGRALLRERFRLPSLPNENQILDVALSPNGRYLAVGAWNRLVRVWEILPPAALAAVSAVTAPLQPGGQPWTAAGQAGASAWLFERAGYRPLPPLSLESQPDVTHVRAVNFSADSKFLAGGSSQSSIWDVETGKHLGLSFVGTGDLICYCITFSSKGSRLAATFGDGLVRVWDTRDGSAAMTAQKQKEAVGGAVFSPVSDDHLAVIRGAEVTIENINPASRQTSFVLEGKGRELETVAFSPDGTHLACRAAGGAVTLWDVAERTLLRTMHPAGAARQEGGLAFLDADRLAAPDGRSGLGMWRVPSGRVGAAVVPPGHARVAAFSRAAGRVATADRGSRIRLWDVDSGDLVRELGQASLDVKALAFSPDGRQLAACGSNATVILWSAETGKVLRTFHGHTLTVGCVAFSPDGRLLATGSADLTVRVWDARTAEPLHVLRGHSGYVSGVCFNGDRDSARLASCGLDRAVKLWDPHAGEEVLTLTGHTAHVAAVAFSPDGRLLASCGHDGTVRLWDATPVDEDRPE